jgi:hypothetical protein
MKTTVANLTSILAKAIFVLRLEESCCHLQQDGRFILI